MMTVRPVFLQGRILILFLLFNISYLLHAVGQPTSQPYLLLRKAGKPAAVIYYEGEEIRYRLKGEDFYRKGLILGFRENGIRFHYFDVPLTEMEVIDIRKRSFQEFHFKSNGTKVMIAGVAFAGIDYLNQKGGESKTLAISGAIVGAGFILRLLQKKKFKPGGKYSLSIIDLR